MGVPVITKDSVEGKLAKLNINKSPRPDQLHPRVLFKTREIVSYPLSLIFKKSLTLGILPTDWKMADVTAIKKGSKSHRGNYRPVSLTSICCKILEQLIREELMTYLLGNGLLSNKQYGFISDRSTSLQLLHMLDR